MEKYRKKMHDNVTSLVSLDSSDTHNRPLANFDPTLWGDYFLTYASNAMTIDSTKKQEHDELKEKVREMLRDADDDLQILELINAVQRLGVSYHFETEIEEALQKLHRETINLDQSDHDDLHVVALRFRLLRQQGYAVSCDIFNKFKDEDGNFKESLITDIRGMLSLYEATHLSTHADEILDEALEFTMHHLKEFSMAKDHPGELFPKQVIHALNRPLRKGLPRLEMRHFITIYQNEASHNETLLRFSKLDFNMIQAQHQEELGHMTKWWKDLAVPTKLPYARDRIVETFFWVLGVYFEPRYSNARRVLTKTVWITSLMDDTYDAYATFEENELFAKAMDRLDISCMNELPEYMQLLYGEIIKLCDEIEEDTRKEGRPYCVHYVKEAFKNLSKAYFTEAKWCRDEHIPTMEEYDIVGVVTSIYPLQITNTLVGLGEIATKEVFHWMSSTPKILRASAYICRVMNDIVSHKFERARGQLLPSSVECYMKQYGVKEEDAVSYLRKKIRDAWKEINQEFLESSKDIPMHVLECVLNMARAADVVYKDDDGYSKPSVTKDDVSLLLVQPILV